MPFCKRTFSPLSILHSLFLCSRHQFYKARLTKLKERLQLSPKFQVAYESRHLLGKHLSFECWTKWSAHWHWSSMQYELSTKHEEFEQSSFKSGKHSVWFTKMWFSLQPHSPFEEHIPFLIKRQSPSSWHLRVEKAAMFRCKRYLSPVFRIHHIQWKLYLMKFKGLDTFLRS